MAGKTFTENYYQTKSGLALCQREVGIKCKQVPVVKKSQPQSAIATVIILRWSFWGYPCKKKRLIFLQHLFFMQWTAFKVVEENNCILYWTKLMYNWIDLH